MTAIEKKMTKVLNTVKMVSENANMNTGNYEYLRETAKYATREPGKSYCYIEPYSILWAQRNNLVKVEQTGKVYGHEVYSADGETYICGKSTWDNLSYAACAALKEVFGKVSVKELRRKQCTIDTDGVKEIVNNLSAQIDELKQIVK